VRRLTEDVIEVLILIGLFATIGTTWCACLTYLAARASVTVFR
jgi:hypothetical protein